jgi:hypothetical protein
VRLLRLWCAVLIRVGLVKVVRFGRQVPVGGV